MNRTIQYAPAMAAEQQADFILKTYAHLFGAISGFVFIEYYLFTTGYAETIARALLGGLFPLFALNLPYARK